MKLTIYIILCLLIFAAFAYAVFFRPPEKIDPATERYEIVKPVVPTVEPLKLPDYGKGIKG